MIKKYILVVQIKRNETTSITRNLLEKVFGGPFWQSFSQKEISAAISSHKAGAHAWKSQAQQSHSWHAISDPPDGEDTGISKRVSHMQKNLHDPRAHVLTHTHTLWRPGLFSNCFHKFCAACRDDSNLQNKSMRTKMTERLIWRKEATKKQTFHAIFQSLKE